MSDVDVDAILAGVHPRSNGADPEPPWEPPDESEPEGYMPEDDGRGSPIDPELLAAIADEYGIGGPAAWALAEKVAGRIASERATGLARRIVRDAALVRDADLDAIEVATAAALLARPRPLRVAVFGELLAEGHNATVVARWKVGKSTLVDNMAKAAVEGSRFLDRFVVANPLRVILFNYELDDEDMADRLAALGLDTGARERLAIVNLRGRRLPLTTPTGRDRAAKWVADHGAQVMVVDPFGAAYASAGGDSENDNAQVRRFLIGLDEIKRLAGCPTLVMPVHTGRGEAVEGDEQGRGASVLEDWPDVRILLTKDRDGRRYVRSEGRAWNLFESPLGFDEATRCLTLAAGEVGMNRAQARRQVAIDALVAALEAEPGATSRTVRTIVAEAGVSNNAAKDSTVAEARARGFVHVHPGPKNAVCHYAGGKHALDEPCPGGWTP